MIFATPIASVFIVFGNGYYKHIVKQIMMKTENKAFRQNAFKKSIQQQLFKHSNPTKTQNQFL